MEIGISDCHRWRWIIQAKENNGDKKMKTLASNIEWAEKEKREDNRSN